MPLPRFPTAPALLALTLALAALLAPAPSAAQNPFTAAIHVNDAAITNHEIDQRRRLLAFVGAPDSREVAIERLIEERLQMQEARRLGLRLSPDQLNEGLAEFAGRAGISVDELLTRTRGEGIERETLTNFLRAGLMWRDLVQARFGPQIRVTPAEIERAMSTANVRPVPEILIAELFLPGEPEFAPLVAQLTPQILALPSIEEFGAAARQVSIAATAEAGGLVDGWIALPTIPEPLQSSLRDARVGQILGPIEVPGAVGFFALRARRENRDVPAGQTELEFRRALLPGGRTEANAARAQQIAADSRSCADFGAAVGRIAPELPPEAVETVTARQTELASGLATELVRMNPGQVSATLVEAGGLAVVQLCARRLVPEPRPSREQVEMMLFNRALEQRAEVYLQTLRAEAEIRRR